MDQTAKTEWTIFYDDGVTTFSHEDGTPEEAPLDGVHGITQIYPNANKTVLEGFDYYRWAEDHWVGGHINDLERWLRSRCPELKYGRFVSCATHKKMMELLHGRNEG